MVSGSKRETKWYLASVISICNDASISSSASASGSLGTKRERERDISTPSLFLCLMFLVAAEKDSNVHHLSDWKRNHSLSPFFPFSMLEMKEELCRNEDAFEKRLCGLCVCLLCLPSSSFFHKKEENLFLLLLLYLILEWDGRNGGNGSNPCIRCYGFFLTMFSFSSSFSSSLMPCASISLPSLPVFVFYFWTHSTAARVTHEAAREESERVSSVNSLIASDKKRGKGNGTSESEQQWKERSDQESETQEGVWTLYVCL